MSHSGPIVPVQGVYSRMLGLSEHGLDDVLDHPFLEQGAAAKIEQAARAAKERGFDLVILDALRTESSRDPAILSVWTNWAASEAEILSHRTGGAVNVALMKGGDFLPMGYAYGNEKLDGYAPEVAAANRELLQQIMEEAGFARTQSNWWHYEYGTPAWAEKTNKQAYLIEARLPPSDDELEALVSGNKPSFTMVRNALVAPAFATSRKRRAVVGHKEKGHFYERHSSSQTAHLAQFYRDLFAVKNVGLVESGLAASTSVIKALVPKRGTIICDKRIYYEVHRSLLQMAQDFDWKIVTCDMTNVAELQSALAQNRGASVVYADNPSNWFLEVLDIKKLSNLAHVGGAKLVLDTTLQPLQNARALGADVEVVSLSKYPSNGFAMGGAYFSDNADIMNAIGLRVAYDGHMLGHPAAEIIYDQSLSLKDRLRTVSEKAEKIVVFLREHPDIAQVNFPDPLRLQGISGGQITFLLKDQNQGLRLEAIISNNTLSGFPLHLAGTFGAAVTTIEHFASNPRHREGIPRCATNEVAIPANMVRLGIGSAGNAEEIIKALRFALDLSSAQQSLPGISRKMTVGSRTLGYLLPAPQAA